MTVAACVLITLSALLAYPSFGLTADTRTAGDVVIGQGERVTDDLYVAAGTLEFNGQAEGDIVIAAGEATIGGTIAGSVHLATGQTEVTGTIDGSLRVLSGTVTLSGSVGGDVVMAGGQLTMPSSGQIGGNLIVAGGTIDIRGRVEGDVTGYTMQSALDGTFQGAVDLRTSSLDIGNTARITGPVTYTSRQDADVSANAQLAQGIEQEQLDPWGDGENPVARASGSLLRTLWALVAGALLVIAAPRLVNKLGTNGRQVLRSLLFGILTLVVAPVLAIVLMVTVIGLPAGILLLGLFLALLYLTQVVVGITIGRFILPRRWNDGSRGFHLLAMTLGVVALGAMRLVPIPYVEAALGLIVTIWGAGAAVMLFGVLNRQGHAETA
jgi:cytoskeletal protein CcmA (bactofilin family)